jgi:hypothetical protein
LPRARSATTKLANSFPPLREELAAAKTALAASEEPPKVVAMHPKVVEQYLRDLDRLDQLIADDLVAGDDGLAKALREIITKVTVMPAPTRQAPEIRIEGYLETLLKHARFDECSSGGERGSGGATHLTPPLTLVYTIIQQLKAA